jgi:hypothetical protein
MAITIQDLLSSDTVSQAVDKINFNFDQLLLNGGGPLGPAGPAGPAGPIGGRGERGTEWYEGTDLPTVTPPTPTPLKADYYLQSNGDVWEYSGLTWGNTGINLTGPQGPTGASIGWSQFGNSPNPGSAGTDNYDLTAKNLSYPALIPSGSNTVSTNNQGVPATAFGIAGPNDNDYPGIPLTSAFQLTTEMAGQLDSSKVTMLVHQRDSGVRAMSFMGGGAIAGEQFEQDDLTKLSTIFLSKDDRLNIAIPKQPNLGSTADERIGFSIDAGYRGQAFRAGNGLTFTTGTKSSTTFAGDTSDVSYILNSLTGAGENAKFNVKTIGTAGSNDFTIGEFPSTSPSPNATYTGGIVSLTNRFAVAANSIISLETAAAGEITLKGVNNTLSVSDTYINLSATGNSPINITSVSGNITVNANGGEFRGYSDVKAELKSGTNQIAAEGPGGDIKLSAQEANSDITLTAVQGIGGQIRLLSADSIRLNGSGATDPYIVLDYTNANTNHRFIQYKGRQAWGDAGVGFTGTIPEDQWIYFAPPITANQTIQRFGSTQNSSPDGTMFNVFNSGNVGESIAIGKPDYPGFGGKYGFIAVNSVNTPPQSIDNGTASGGATSSDYNQAEKFKVDKSKTKISNRVIWGGKNGINSISYDPYAAYLPNPDITVSTPYVRIVVGRTSNVTSSNILNMTNNPGFNLGFNLNFTDELAMTGNRVFVEVLNVPSKFGLTINSCFIAGTNISLSNGDHKNIEHIIEGDSVITYNEITGLIEDGIVGSIKEHQVPVVIKLLFADGTSITTTPEHPFFIEGQWVKAGELQVGDNTHKLDGNKLAISEIELIEEPHTVYNLLDVGSNHNFYANETLVHNKGGGTPQSVIRKAYGTITLSYEPWSISGTSTGSTVAGTVVSSEPTAASAGGWEVTTSSRVFEFINVGLSNTFYNSGDNTVSGQGINIGAGWRCLGSAPGAFFFGGDGTGLVPALDITFDAPSSSSSGDGSENAT